MSSFLRWYVGAGQLIQAYLLEDMVEYQIDQGGPGQGPEELFDGYRQQNGEGSLLGKYTQKDSKKFQSRHSGGGAQKAPQKALGQGILGGRAGRRAHQDQK